jgi:uncharacterized protein Veg
MLMITNMVSKKDSLQKIKSDVDGYIGQKVCIKANIGRNKCEYKEGILTSTYSDNFTVACNVMNSTFNLNYSYREILTNDVELTLPNGESIAGYDYSVTCHSKF